MTEIRLNGVYSSSLMQRMCLLLGFPIYTMDKTQGIIAVDKRGDANKVISYLKERGYPKAEIIN
jgi:hypothetical protein